MDELQAVLDQALSLLAEGARDPASPWRNPALATFGTPPGLRTVVLRAFRAHDRRIELHTDARSPKIAVLREHPPAALHVWDPGRRIQIRADGIIKIANSVVTDAAWAALPDRSRATYRINAAPGTPISAPGIVKQDMPPEAARAVFSVLDFRIEGLEYLSLAHAAHQRARFRWRGDELTATWLVP